jgi:hypothetical protein
MTDQPKSQGASIYGAGWGGPAKGAGRPIGQRTAAQSRAAKAAMSAETIADRKAAQAVTREKVLAMYVEIMTDKNAPAMARVTAGDRWLDRVEGKAPQAIVTHDGGEKSLEDLINASFQPATPTVN